MSDPSTRRVGIAVIVFQVMLLVALVMMGVKVYSSPDAGKPVYAIFAQVIPVERISEATKNPDALKIAYDAGVLELLSLSFTIFTVVLAIAAVFGFWTIRGAAIKAAEKAAKEEAKEQAEKTAERIAKEWIEKNATAIFEEAAKTRSGPVTPATEIKKPEIDEAITDSEEIK